MSVVHSSTLSSLTYYGQRSAATPAAPAASSEAMEVCQEPLSGKTRKPKRKAHPALHQDAEGESRFFAPPIDAQDLTLLKNHIRVLNQAERAKLSAWVPFAAAWVPGSKAWNDANCNMAAQSIFDAVGENKAGNMEEEPVSPQEERLNRINQARDIAAEGRKWFYDAEEAYTYLETKMWDKAEAVLEKLKVSQKDNPQCNKEPVFIFLLAKVKALQGKLSDAYHLYNELNHKYNAVDYLSEIENQPLGIVKLLTQKVRNNVAQATAAEQLIVARCMDLSNADQHVIQLLDAFARDNHDAWKALVERLNEDKLRWIDLERLGVSCHLTERQKATDYFSKAIGKAPAEHMRRLWNLHFRVSNSPVAFKKLVELGDPKMTLAHAQEIKKSNVPEALKWAQRAMALANQGGMIVAASSPASASSSARASTAPPSGAQSSNDPQIEGADLETYRKAQEFYRLTLWEQGTDNQDAECMYQLALYHWNTSCSDTPTMERISTWLFGLFESAHNKGHPEAAFTYARLIHTSLPNERVAWYKRAADLGHKEAPYQLGMIALGEPERFLSYSNLKYIAGCSKIYIERVINPLRVAMDRGNEKALKLKDLCDHLEQMFIVPSSVDIHKRGEAFYQIARCFNGEKTACLPLSQSPGRYMEWLKAAATYGHPKALTLSANRMQYRELDEGIKNLRRAAQVKGDAEAQYLLATYLGAGQVNCLYDNSHDYYVLVRNEGASEKELYIKSAAQNYFPARMKLAAIYVAEKNYIGAYGQYEKAADTGDVEALFQLGLCFQKGLGPVKNLKTAEAKFLLAVQQGHGKSMTTIGDLYKAKGDIQKAKNWYSQAIEAKMPDGGAYARLASL